MTQRSSSARVLSIMQELQQLRQKVSVYSEKNRELAKALTTTKQELTKARAAQSTAFSDRVVKWMESHRTRVEIQHQAVQCGFEELDRDTCASFNDKDVELRSSAIVNHNCGTVGTQNSKSRLSSKIIFAKSLTTVARTNQLIKKNKTYKRRNSAKGNISKEDKAKGNTSRSHPSQSHAIPFAQVTSKLTRPGPQAGLKRRLRERDSNVSYVEPKLNTKLRRGEYYGLGKRTGRPISRPVKSVTGLGPYSAKSALEHSCNVYRSRRTERPVKRISYEEPKLNTKLRQGDKFTFSF